MKKISSLLFIALCCITSIYAKEIPPKANTHVSDFAHILSGDEVAKLEAFLRGYEDSTSTQFAVVIEKSLDGESLFDRSYEIAEKWGIGKKGKDNGVLIYIAFEDRKYWVQTGYGLESRLNGGVVGEIFRRDFVPHFKQQEYYEGIYEACYSLMRAASGLYVQEQEETGKGHKGKGIPFWVILIVVIIVITIISRGNRGGGFGTYTGRGFRRGGWFIGGGSSGGFGGSSGSSWGGFGGGSFGGGGAGGSW